MSLLSGKRVRAALPLLAICAVGSMPSCSSSEGDGEEPLVCEAIPVAGDALMVDVAADVGIVHEHHFATDFCEITDTVGGPGVCAFDYDQDGDVDLYFADRASHPNRLYENDGSGSFSDVSAGSGADFDGDTMGCLAFDYNGDGALDLYLSNVGEDRLLENQGGTFVDVTESAGLGDDGFSASATAGDIDGDGDLDLFVARLVDVTTCPEDCYLLPIACASQRNLLYINQGGSFTEDGPARGITAEEPTLASLFFDFDEDGDLDLYVGNDIGLLFDDRLFINDGSGNFVDRAEKFGLQSFGSDTMGVAVGDIDGDERLDMVTTDFEDKPLHFFRCYDPDLACSFESFGLESASYVQWGVGVFDFDHDTWPDVFAVSGDVYGLEGDPDQLFMSAAGNIPTLASSPDLESKTLGRGAAFADLDGDADIDIVVANAGSAPRVLRNEAAAGHSLLLTFDSLAIGAEVRAVVGERTLVNQVVAGGSYLGSSPPMAHFGLGEACEASVTVTFPDGTAKDLGSLAAGHHAVTR